MENLKPQIENETRRERDSLMKAIYLQIVSLPNDIKIEITSKLNRYLS